MKNIKLFLFLLLPFFLFSQEKEKRLALVIGNANYDKGELKNPVNDARLIASTLDSLDFDVILKENLSTKRDMTAAIREFGSRRSEYDVAFVYYAGHGVQVDDENFLLPTKETFEEEFDVIDYGVSVQNIMRYLRAQTNQVNILILDACRDNPFESSWGNTRSLKGQGLAKIPPPTGSLIAFSTDSGQTAPDGDGENSVYSISLAKNMLLEDTSIDQVFRNVRSEVLQQTDGGQRPVEATQLTGKTFYLKKPTPKLFLDKIDKLFLEREFEKGLELSKVALFLHPNNPSVLAKKGHCNLLLSNDQQAFNDYTSAININPKQFDAYKFTFETKEKIYNVGIHHVLMSSSQFLQNIDIDKFYDNWVKNDKSNPIPYITRSYYYRLKKGNNELANKDLLQAKKIIMSSENIRTENVYNLISNKNYSYHNSLNVDLSEAFGSFYYVNGQYEEALKYLDLSLEFVNGSIKESDILKQKSVIFENIDKMEEAIKILIDLSIKNPKDSFVQLGLAKIYVSLGDFQKAELFFNKSVKQSANEGQYEHTITYVRAIFYYLTKNYYAALEDLNNLDKIWSNYNILLVRGLIYKDLGAISLAKRDLKKYLLNKVFSDVKENQKKDIDWFKNLVSSREFKVLDFHYAVYSNKLYSKKYPEYKLSIPVPWKGDKNLVGEIKAFFLKN